MKKIKKLKEIKYFNYSLEGKAIISILEDFEQRIKELEKKK